MAVLYACPVCYADFRRWSACLMHLKTSDCKEAARIKLEEMEEPELKEYCRAAAQKSTTSLAASPKTFAIESPMSVLAFAEFLAMHPESCQQLESVMLAELKAFEGLDCLAGLAALRSLTLKLRGSTKDTNEKLIEFSPKLRGARSPLYRRRFLQVNTRWKALDEIYKIYISARLN